MNPELPLNEPRPEWMHQAACIGKPADWFYPKPNEWATRAKQVCAHCPVRTECYTHAMDPPERHGVWGGVSQRGRKDRSRTWRDGDRTIPTIYQEIVA